MTEEDLREIETKVRDKVAAFHPGVVFTDIRIAPRASWYGDDMIDVWAIYEGDVTDLAAPAQPSLRTEIQDILWDMGLDASPSLRLIARADIEGDHAEVG